LKRGREAGNRQGGVDLLMTSMMDYRMKQSLVYVLCSLILAVGFVVGMSMGRYHVGHIGDRGYFFFKVDRMTGTVWESELGADKFEWVVLVK
jgi:hypothetical protein